MDEKKNSPREDVFRYLNALRKSGMVNMFGAAPFIQDTFGLDRHSAQTLLQEWMENFEDESEE